MTGDTSLADAMMGLAEVAAVPGQPLPFYDKLSATVAALIGHRLFTLMVLDMAADEAARIYSSDPQSYPVGGRKPLGEMTGWGEVVIVGRRPYLGRTAADIRWAFFDHELIESLGCGAVINVPVQWDGQILGTMNILDAEYAYDETHLARVLPLAPVLVGPFLQAIASPGLHPEPVGTTMP